MTKKIAIFTLLLIPGFLISSYPQENYRDPFEPLLPVEVDEEVQLEELRAQEREREKREEIIEATGKAIFSISVEGILWGGDLPQVIIDGEVYKPGDNIKDLDAQIFKIEKSTVFISCGEKIYRVKIGKNKEES